MGTVSVTGPYVLDADHGWLKVHPVERIEVLR
jgi:outer membrane receptor for ferrienterochelin and colicin